MVTQFTTIIVHLQFKLVTTWSNRSEAFFASISLAYILYCAPPVNLSINTVNWCPSSDSGGSHGDFPAPAQHPQVDKLGRPIQLLSKA